MKIIPESDRRFNLLPQMWDKWNFDNILFYLHEGSKPYFIIPFELSIANINKSEHNKCSMTEDGHIFSGSYCSTRMKEFTGLTTQEYFDLVVLHINDTDNRPRCNNCGVPLPFSGGIPTGYGSHGHRWNESDYHFCSRRCAANYQFNGDSGYENSKRYFSTGGTFLRLSGDSKLSCWINSRRTAFINKGDPNDKASLYVARTKSGALKFGVTTDLEYRARCSGMVDQYITYLNLINSTRLEIANIEADIKFYLKSTSEYICDKETEYLFWNKINELIGTDHPII